MKKTVSKHVRPKTPFATALGGAIYRAMVKRGLTREEFANQIGCKPSTVCRYLGGSIRLHFDTILKIASVLEVPVSRLVPVGFVSPGKGRKDTIPPLKGGE